MGVERAKPIYPVRIGKTEAGQRPGLSQGFTAALQALLARGPVGGPTAVRAATTAQRTSVPAAHPGPARATAFDGLISAAAEREGVDPNLVKAVVEAESGFNPNAVSSAGAVGLMQLMPGTARSLGVTDSRDPAANIAGGVKFLRSMLDRFDSVPLALAAYNAGPGAVEKYGGVPPYAETRTYVDRILQLQARNEAGGRQDGGANGKSTA